MTITSLKIVKSIVYIIYYSYQSWNHIKYPILKKHVTVYIIWCTEAIGSMLERPPVMDGERLKMMMTYLYDTTTTASFIDNYLLYFSTIIKIYW